jgi:hypothetical protein
MATRARFEDLEGGMWLEEAIEAFVAGCNIPNRTLWITEGWAGPLFERLRERVRGPIGDDLADALRQVVRKEHRLEDLVAWVETPDPKPPFRVFARSRDDARDAAEFESLRRFLAGHADQAREVTYSRWLPSLWLLDATLTRPPATPACPRCEVPGVQEPWAPAPGSASGLQAGVIVACPSCRALLDILKTD